MKTLTQSFKTIALALVLALGVSYVSAWTAPTATPTGGNVASPLNTSVNAQYKAGTLGVDLFRSYGNLIVDGNVGIGTINPGAKLEVLGNLKVGNSNSSCGAINAGEIRFITDKFLGCDGTDWVELGGYAAESILPTADISASPVIIATGQSATLTWTSTDAIACAASGGWSGGKAISGSEVVSPASSATFTLTCNNASGSGADSVVVDVKQWTDTTGSGNYGESCNAWLTRTGQAGVNGSGNRLYLDSSNPAANNWCLYRGRDGTQYEGAQMNDLPTWTNINYKPINIGGSCIGYGGFYSCSYDYWKTQTRR